MNADYISRESCLRVLQVYAAGSEDMDTLTFNAPVIFRHLTVSEAKKQPVGEINLKMALEGLGMNMDQVGAISMKKRFEGDCHGVRCYSYGAPRVGVCPSCTLYTHIHVINL
jgi:hypothetical protein